MFVVSGVLQKEELNTKEYLFFFEIVIYSKNSQQNKNSGIDQLSAFSSAVLYWYSSMQPCN